MGAQGPPQSLRERKEGGGGSTCRDRLGVLRLDTRTGQISQCSRTDAGWACKVVPDERSALEMEIARLQGENATLKKELLARGLPVPGAPGPCVAKRGEPELKPAERCGRRQGDFVS